MTSKYLMMGENLRRRAEVPCLLEPPLKEKWAIQYEGMAANPPLIEDSLVFLRQSDNTLAAFNEDTHRLLWKYDAKGALRLLYGGKIYFAGDDDQLHILDSRSGRLLTKYQFALIGDAAIIDDLFLSTFYERSSGIVAFEERSGKEVWRYKSPPETMFTTVFCSSERHILLGEAGIALGEGGKVLALGAESGKVTWEHDVSDLPLRMPGEQDRQGAPTGVARLNNGIVIVTVSKDFLVGLSIETGERLWTWTSNLGNAVVAGDGYLYDGRYYQTGANGTYHIINAETGATTFETSLKLPKKQHTVWGWSPILASETHLFVGSNDGHVLAFHRDTGEYVWSILPKRGSAGSRFASVNERLYYGDRGGRLHCLAPKGK